MTIDVRWAVGVLAVVFTSACFRYVEHTRPLTASDCPPEPHRGTWRVTGDLAGPPLVRGRVFDADDSTQPPLQGAVVSVESARRGVLADTLGRFQLDSLPPGRHTVVVRHIGYRLRREAVDVPPSRRLLIEVGMEHQHLDGCPGFGVLVERKRVWRWPWQ